MSSTDSESLFRLNKDLSHLLDLGFSRIRPKSRDDKKMLLVTRTPSRSGLICVNMEQLGCPPLYPVLYDRGVERYSLVILQDHKLGALSPMLERQLCKFRVVEKRKIDASEFLERIASPLPSILSKLTQKQAESLAIAFARGYYSLPKRTPMSEIALHANAKRSTYREHVRKAESKIIGEVVPYLQLVPRKVSHSCDKPLGKP